MTKKSLVSLSFLGILFSGCSSNIHIYSPEEIKSKNINIEQFAESSFFYNNTDNIYYLTSSSPINNKKSLAFVYQDINHMKKGLSDICYNMGGEIVEKNIPLLQQH